MNATQLFLMVLKNTWPIILIFGAMFLVFGLFSNKIKELVRAIKDQRPWPYKKRNLMTFIEQRMFFRLQEAFPHANVFSQVAMNRILAFPDDNKWLYKLGGKSIDYVVCRKKDASILFAVELDDSSHEREERREADHLKTAALEDAGIVLFRWNTKNLPEAAEVRETVKKRLTDLNILQ
jgi:very-short-patch-repair endonuclease